MGKNKVTLILEIVMCLVASVVLFYNFFQCVTADFLPESELVYEDCTFKWYDHEVERTGRFSSETYYYIYVNEYDKPLKIDGKVFKEIDEKALSEINMMDKITVSIFNKGGDLYLYSISHGDVRILSYDVYVSEHMRANEIQFYSSMAIGTLCLAGGIYCIMNYKKKSKRLPWI